jgi:hypothetical protein
MDEKVDFKSSKSTIRIAVDVAVHTYTKIGMRRPARSRSPRDKNKKRALRSRGHMGVWGGDTL